MNIEYTLVL